MELIRKVFHERKAVIWALINKEMVVKFGASYLSYAWLLLEPLIYISLFCFVFLYVGKDTALGLGMITFITTGVLPFLFFRRTVQGASTVIDANRQLLNYSKVNIYDGILARFLLEVIITVCVTIILLFFIVINDTTVVYSPERILIASFLLIIFTLGISFTMAIICYYLPDFAKINAIVFRLLMFISGVFYSLSQIPSSAAYYLSFNPIFQVIETIRTSLTMSYPSSFLSLKYTAVVSLLTLFLGISVYFYARNDISMGSKSR